MQKTSGQTDQSGNNGPCIIKAPRINLNVGTEYKCGRAILKQTKINCMTGNKQTKEAQYFCDEKSMRPLGKLVKKDDDEYTFENGEVIKIAHNCHGTLCFIEVKEHNEQIPSFKLNDTDPYKVTLECNQLTQDTNVYVIFDSHRTKDPLYFKNNTILLHIMEECMFQ